MNRAVLRDRAWNSPKSNVSMRRGSITWRRYGWMQLHKLSNAIATTIMSELADIGGWLAGEIWDFRLLVKSGIASQN